MGCRRITTNAVFAGALVLAVGGARAADPTPPSRLTAEFVMERTLKVLSDTVSSSGRMVMGGPGLLRWEMTKPSRSLLLIAKGRATIHYPDLGITKTFDLASDPVMRVMSEHLLALTSGAWDRLAALYEVTVLDGGVRRLVPRETAVRQVFSEIRVSLGQGGVVSWVELVSPSGDLTRITFSSVRLNPELPAGYFEKP
ncbi:MAG: outer membrane lipoprotein carrier protein LolA [Deltaproteobacteria bacterium]|nr:outer membrane lipoprotein carrier protein LolA [Deltaproteobacteria bacterium]